MEKKRNKGRSKSFRDSQRKGYTRTSPAICMVMHSLGGYGISDKIAQEALDAVTEVAVKYGYVINFARQ